MLDLHQVHTLRQIAAHVGVNRQNVRDWLAGAGTPTPEHFRQLLTMPRPDPKMKLTHTLAERLRAWQGSRQAAEAAADLGVNLRSYENWLQGRAVPRGLALNALEQRLASKRSDKKTS